MSDHVKFGVSDYVQRAKRSSSRRSKPLGGAVVSRGRRRTVSSLAQRVRGQVSALPEHLSLSVH